MLEKYAEVPSAVAYPLEEVTQGIFQHLYRGGELVDYYTSTFNYMMGLAIMEGYTDIWLAGFEFVSETEYFYQAVGAAYWVGFANGRGINVHMHPDCPFMKSERYGFEGWQYVTEKDIMLAGNAWNDLYEKYMGIAVEAEQEYVQKAQTPGFDSEILNEMYGQLKSVQGLAYIYSGARQECDHILNGLTANMVSRQTLEAWGVKMKRQLESVKATANTMRERYRQKELLNPNGDDNEQLFVEVMRAETEIYLVRGALQAIGYFIKRCDMVDPGYVMVNDLVWVNEQAKEI
jgi:hypothetical protein